MRRASFEQLNCSVAQTLEVVGDWWSLLIVRDIFFGVTRFDDIQRRLVSPVTPLPIGWTGCPTMAC
jgi:DNA-binding HxlR family transcriptional regulator